MSHLATHTGQAPSHCLRQGLDRRDMDVVEVHGADSSSVHMVPAILDLLAISRRVDQLSQVSTIVLPPPIEDVHRRRYVNGIAPSVVRQVTGGSDRSPAISRGQHC